MRARARDSGVGGARMNVADSHDDDDNDVNAQRETRNAQNKTYARAHKTLKQFAGVARERARAGLPGRHCVCACGQARASK